MRALALVVFSIFMVGCASPIKVNVPNIGDSAGISVVDLRPASEAKTKEFSRIAISEAYGMWRQGDKELDPVKMRIFQHRVHEKFSPSSVKDVKVHHFVVYQNLKFEKRRGAALSGSAGLLGKIVATETRQDEVDVQTSTITKNEFDSFEREYKRAFYTSEENSKRASMYVVYLDAEVDGKRNFIKAITPYRLSEGQTGEPHVFAIETAMAYFLDQY